MINYPNGKKSKTNSSCSIKHDTSHRGMNLEEDINLSNEYYRTKNIAIIHKKPTPIQIVKVDYPKRAAAKIVEAYYKTPSTTDYNGIYKGNYVDFEAKETKTLSFPLGNISLHQIEHLKSIITHNGIAFVIIAFTSINEVYLVNAKYIIEKYENREDKKSISYDYISTKGHLIKQGYSPRLDYIEIIDRVYLGG